MSWIDHLPALQVFSLLGLGFLFPLLYNWYSRQLLVLGAVVSAFNLAASLVLVWQVQNQGPLVYPMGGWSAPWGIELVADLLGVYMVLIVTGVCLAVYLFALAEGTGELALGVEEYFYSLVFLLVGSLIAIAYTRDLFNLYVFFEVAAVSSGGIVVGKIRGATLYASLKYLLLSTLGSGCFLLAIAITYTLTGNLNMDYIQSELVRVWMDYPYNTMLVLGLLTTGFCVKAALFPLHIWLPDAHGYAPSPASALLSGLVVKIYAFSLVRVYSSVFPADLLEWLPLGAVLQIFGALAVVLGSVFALYQTDLKRLLAYSTVAQMGFIFLGLGVMNLAGLVAGLFQILNHALVKSFLFLSAGNVIHQLGVRRLKDLDGMYARMPWTTAVFTVGALSMIGIPGFSGFITKVNLGMAALEEGQLYVIGVLLLSGLLNAFYYLPILFRAYFNPPPTPVEPGKSEEARWACLLPVLVLAGISVFLGWFPGTILGLLEEIGLELMWGG